MDGAKPQRLVSRRAPAKLNLRLKITGRRPDGYHNLVSVMVPVALYDRIDIQFVPSRGISLSCRGLRLPQNDKNLAFRAAAAFCEKTGLNQGISLSLTKDIPVAAGLGGGSSDAAAVLRALNHMTDAPLSTRDLETLAVGLGADVPFFLKGCPCIAQGIGEKLTPIEKWPNLWYIIIMPPIEVSTTWVYGELDRKEAIEKGHVLAELELTSIEYQAIMAYLGCGSPQIDRLLENDLERVTVSRFPILRRIKTALLRAGAEGTLMSGSGPSVFGVFRSRESAEKAKGTLLAKHLGHVFLAGGLDKTRTVTP